MSLGRVLFIGTGGGNDVFSATLAIRCLRAHGWQWDSCDIAGVISPFHRHTVAPVSRDGLYRTLPTSRRFLLRRTKHPEIKFIDARVAGMVDAGNRTEAQSVLALSLEHGTDGLLRTFTEELRHRYDFFVLVDVGGDILYRGREDEHILSPMFDAMVLRAFVDSKLPGVLFEAGPGTDGELTPESLTRSLDEYAHARVPIPSAVIDVWEQYYDRWIAPYRPGRTVPITIQAYRSAEPEIRMDYRARGHLGATRVYANFEQRIDTRLCKDFYLIDPAVVRNPFAVACRSPLDWFAQTQVRQRHTNNEANMEYVPIRGELVQFLTPSPLLAEEDRRRLIMQGLDELDAGMIEEALMLGSDLPVVIQQHRGSFVLHNSLGGFWHVRLAN